MKNETLKQIINQIKRYNLIESFSNIDQFKEWVSKLNSIQINNFLGLDMDLEEIKNLKKVLINSDLLKCKDYKQRVVAISTLKNDDDCWHFNCKPNFLKSKNFYRDIEMLSKADTAKYSFWVLGEDVFINSPYHDEDLKLIVETHDTNQDKPLDSVVSDALSTVACNINSIKSPYHKEDMKLISRVGSNCLQVSHSYPERSLNNLAVNEVSLSDKYHLENMKILANNPIAREFLYRIMTNSEIIKGKNYRKEVEVLLNAKSKLTARALYYYIVNPERKFNKDLHFYDDYEFDIKDARFVDSECVSGKADPDYINNLSKINQIDDKFVMHYVSLLMNPNFINSPYKKFDLELLQIVSSKPIFLDLYRLMSNRYSLHGSHHRKDAFILSQTSSNDVRNLLLKKAVDKYSLTSNNHEYDMEYISELNLDLINKKIYNEMYYYLFSQQGIDDSQHKEKLEKLLQGILVERSTNLSSYLDYLQDQIENSEKDLPQIIESSTSDDYEQRPKIFSLLKKYIKKQR